MVRIAVGLLILMLMPAAAHAEKRMALLIGNQSYTNEIGRLANPHNDVSLLERTLKGLGFEVVTVRDAGLAVLHQAVNAYARRVQAAGANTVAFFYYSGHGAADAGTNYLIPVDVKTTETGELWDQSLRLTEITRKLKAEAGNATHFVVFDACRNTLKLTKAGSRALVQSKGFVPIPQETGMLIAYATAEGELASDVGAGAGPYAKVLSEEIVKSGVEAVSMFRRVQVRVRSAIGQEPWLGFSALGEVHLAGAQTANPTPPVPEVSEAAREWARVDKSSTIELETFLRRHGSSAEADYARARLRDLKKQQLTVVTPPPVQPATPRPDPPKPAVVVSPTEQSCVDVLVGSQRRCLKLGAGKSELFKDCPNCPEMVIAPAGRFTMGSPTDEPERTMSPGWEGQVSVTISKPFAVGRFTVTRGEFAAFVSASGHKMDGSCHEMVNGIVKDLADRNWRSPGFAQTDRHPVVCVNWSEAKAYVTWLTTTTGKTYRLLSEAEREYVGRAGTITAFWWGSSISPSQANYNGTDKGGGTASEWRKATVPVDTFAANPWGLFNVHGNVQEWVEDCAHDKNEDNPRDGSAWTGGGDCSFRMLRNGSWRTPPKYLRSAERSSFNRVGRLSFRGFRVARTL
jgi:formylglycine-generating enzyme required for sulfatase activity